MSTTLDVDDIIRRAGPVLHQRGQEIQSFGQLVRLPIALAESVCKRSVENLNQLQADTMTLRDLYKKHHRQVLGHTFYQRMGLILLLGLSSACGASRSAPASAPEASSFQIPVQIDNRNFSTMDIYVVEGGQRFLIGQAGGLATTTLTIRNMTRGDGRVRLLAEPIGAAQRVATPTLVVPPGQSIFWTIGSDPATSTAYTG